MIKQFCIAGLLLLSNTIFSQVPFYDGSSWGLVARDGTVLTKPSYDSIPKFLGRHKGQDIFKVVVKDTVFLVDQFKNCILTSYDDYGVLRSPLIRVKKHNKYGIYNLNTNECIVKPKYDMLKSDYSFSDLLYKVELKGKKSVINKEGKKLIPWDEYKKIELENFEGKQYIIARFSGDEFLVYDMDGKEKTKFFTSSRGELFNLFDDRDITYELKLYDDKKNYEVKDSWGKTLFKTQLTTPVVLDRLLYSERSERMALVTIYKESDKEGLFDLMYEEKITEAAYDTLYALKSPLERNVVRRNGLYGMMWFDEKEDPDYEAKHVIVNVTPIIFSKIATLYENSFDILFELPNGYKCFNYYDKETKEMKFYLPTVIQKKYNL